MLESASISIGADFIYFADKWSTRDSLREADIFSVPATPLLRKETLILALQPVFRALGRHLGAGLLVRAFLTKEE